MNEEMKKEVKYIRAIPVYPIPEYTGLRNGDEYEVPLKWDGHAVALPVGRTFQESDKVESFFTADKETGTTEIFEKLRGDMPLLTKNLNVRDSESRELTQVVMYYIPYRVEGHSMCIPTVVDKYVDHCMNVNYSIGFEVLLVADEEYKRYITFEYETGGYYSSSFFDQVRNLEEMFDELFRTGQRGFKETVENGTTELSVEFYEDTGNVVPIEVESVDELLSMVTSIRTFKIDFEITN